MQANDLNIHRAMQKLGISPQRLSRVSLHSWQGVLSRIEKTFVVGGGPIHWSNLGRINPPFTYVNVHYRSGRVGWWLGQLHNLLPDATQPFYLLVEDDSKYWVYEGFLPEIVLFVGELVHDDFYLVDKKMSWLASENHHSSVVFAGAINVEQFSYSRLTADTFGPYSQEMAAFKRGDDIILRRLQGEHCK